MSGCLSICALWLSGDQSRAYHASCPEAAGMGSSSPVNESEHSSILLLQHFSSLRAAAHLIWVRVGVNPGLVSCQQLSICSLKCHTSLSGYTVNLIKCIKRQKFSISLMEMFKCQLLWSCKRPLVYSKEASGNCFHAVKTALLLFLKNTFWMPDINKKSKYQPEWLACKISCSCAWVFPGVVVATASTGTFRGNYYDALLVDRCQGSPSRVNARQNEMKVPIFLLPESNFVHNNHKIK